MSSLLIEELFFLYLKSIDFNRKYFFKIQNIGF